MKLAMVTGGSQGLGLAICSRLLDDGWAVKTTARTVSPALKELSVRYGSRLAIYHADFEDSDSVRHAIRNAQLVRGIDAFIGNAAMALEGMLSLTLDSDIERCFRVNVIANVLIAKAAVKGMLACGGTVVFISSIAAKTGFSGLSVYSATKGALLSFSRSIAREYGERGIRCNCVLPGFLDTSMTRKLRASRRAQLEKRTALKRLGTVQDVLGTVAFLLSDEARYLTGTEIIVDGGNLT